MSIEFILIWLACWLFTFGLTVDRIRKVHDALVFFIMVIVMVVVWPFFLGLYIDDRFDHIQAALNRMEKKL